MGSGYEMGYILPITNYQYEQYALREIGRKTNPYKQKEIPSIIQVENRLQGKEEEGSENIFISPYTSANQTIKKKEYHLLAAKLTGKGSNFHAWI
ncbi:hypothetical protein [Niallia sp. 03133]|uniref:hypothetical protein n=1 Tax=Niallia sp. 03133 TaxID=3458060 RepID=UPI004045011D